MPVYQPNQPEFYPDPEALKGYQMLNNVMGLNLDGREAFEKDIFQSYENLKAFVHSRLPYKVDKPGNLKELLNLLPGLKADPKQREARRQMSARAREAISDLAARKYFSSGGFSKARDLRVLMSYDNSDAGINRNKEIFNTIINGTPEECGKLLENHVNNSLELYEKVLNGNPSDEYLVENFEKVFALQELMTVAQNLRKECNRSDDPKSMVVSEDVIQKLILFEQRSNEIERIVQRVNMIANANYEHLNMEYLNTCDDRSYKKFQDYLGIDLDDEDMLNLNRSLSQRNMGATADWVRGLNGLIREYRLMSAVAKDFGKNKEQATLKFVNNEGQIMQTNFNIGGDQKAAVVAGNLTKGGVLVTSPDGQVACYQVTVSGQVTKIPAAEMLNDMEPDMKDVLDTMKWANRGLFIGSKEFSDALNAAENLSKLMSEAPKPLAGDDNLKEQCQKAMAACKAYMDKKNPEAADFYAVEFKNDREKLRYEAIEKAFNYFRNGMEKVDLQKQANEKEMSAALNRGMQGLNAIDKAEKVYGDGATIAASNAGTIADELRAVVNRSLKQMLNGEFDIDDARVTVSNMVLLELIKRGRSQGENGVVAGDLESALAAKPVDVVLKMRQDPHVKAACENLTEDTLRQFVLNNEAKALAKQILQNAKEHNPDAMANELQKQNEKEVQKQAEGPKVGF